MKRHPKALVVNASPHTPSVTERLCTTFEEAFCKSYAQRKSCIQRLNLPDCQPPHSDGKYEHKTTVWRQAVQDADVLFIGTPTYWFGIPSVLKAFIDHIGNNDQKLSKQERIAIIAVRSKEGGEIGALNALVVPLNMMGFTILGNSLVYYREGKDRGVWKDLRDAAKDAREYWSNTRPYSRAK